MKIKVRISNTAFEVDQIQREDLVCLEYTETQYGVCSPDLAECIQMMGEYLKEEYNLEGEIRERNLWVSL